ncbi:hypothetical protein [Amycolatopsis speibonae]|uniref:Uncharacterized protein n=1 Tax=Amycolatopsis speibonae TaxID=1450224 RepID=A0ABV7PA86_9PSEU
MAREGQIEQAYRDAVVAGDPKALSAFAGWLEEQSGRGAEIEQAYQDAIVIGHPEIYRG